MLRVSANMWWEDHFQRFCGSMRLPAFLSCVPIDDLQFFGDSLWVLSNQGSHSLKLVIRMIFCYANRYVWIKPVAVNVKCTEYLHGTGPHSTCGHMKVLAVQKTFTCSASIFWYISLAIPQINITLIPCNCYVCWHILNYCNWERNSEVARSSWPYLLRVMTHARLKVHSSKERTISLLNQASWHALWMMRVKLTSNHT